MAAAGCSAITRSTHPTSVTQCGRGIHSTLRLTTVCRCCSVRQSAIGRAFDCSTALMARKQQQVVVPRSTDRVRSLCSRVHCWPTAQQLAIHASREVPRPQRSPSFFVCSCVHLIHPLACSFTLPAATCTQHATVVTTRLTWTDISASPLCHLSLPTWCIAMMHTPHAQQSFHLLKPHSPRTHAVRRSHVLTRTFATAACHAQLPPASPPLLELAAAPPDYSHSVVVAQNRATDIPATATLALLCRPTPNYARGHSQTQPQSPTRSRPKCSTESARLAHRLLRLRRRRQQCEAQRPAAVRHITNTSWATPSCRTFVPPLAAVFILSSSRPPHLPSQPGQRRPRSARLHLPPPSSPCSRWAQSLLAVPYLFLVFSVVTVRLDGGCELSPTSTRKGGECWRPWPSI